MTAMAPLENYIVEHCAPTLANLKTGTLFCVDTRESAELLRQIGLWNGFLRGKGISIMLLRQGEHKALVYLYRRSQLERDLKTEGVAEFLHSLGYNSQRTSETLERLRERFEEEAGIPHEIGVFLGYPLCDVIGYIRNRGRNSKLTGCWQVYGDVDKAAKLFAKYRKCSNVYSKLWNEGRSVQQLTVCA